METQEQTHLSSARLKSFFRQLSISAKKAEEKRKLRQGIQKQMDKIKDVSVSKSVDKDELLKAIERLEEKINLVLEPKKSAPRPQKEMNVFEDVFQRIEMLGAKVNAISGMLEKSQQEQKKMDPQRIYELEEKINKKLDKLTQLKK